MIFYSHYLTKLYNREDELGRRAKCPMCRKEITIESLIEITLNENEENQDQHVEEAANNLGSSDDYSSGEDEINLSNKKRKRNSSYVKNKSSLVTFINEDLLVGEEDPVEREINDTKYVVPSLSLASVTHSPEQIDQLIKSDYRFRIPYFSQSGRFPSISPAAQCLFSSFSPKVPSSRVSAVLNDMESTLSHTPFAK